GVSTHLTIGVHAWTRFAIAEQILQQALHRVAQDPAIRGSLPIGVDFNQWEALRPDAELVRRTLVSAIQSTDLNVVFDTLRRHERGTQRAAPIGPIRQLRDADQISNTTMITLRRHVAAYLDHAGGRSVVRSRADDFTLREEDVAPMKGLLAGGAASADDLGLDLARRLVLAGLATVE
ncbi:MAG: putative ribosomal oxygenase, partial [Propionibacteriaceae bacterium]|nr:putative ribosomal oxygenase [Propionibacteriaceae bacterium]